MNDQYPFIETIRVENGQFRLLDYHLARMSRTCREAFGADAPLPVLDEETVPKHLRNSVVKCRIAYGRTIGSIVFESYAVRKVSSLRLVEADSVDYHLKYADRGKLDALRALRDGADEILIVKNGLVTDTSYSNIVCWAGERLLTPRHPLLRGVMRDWLLAAGEVEETDITPAMLREGNGEGITGVCMINAMMPMGRGPLIPLDGII